MKLQPIHNKVLIKTLDAPDKIGLIYLPDQAKQKPVDGIVVNCSSGWRDDAGNLHEMTVKAGQKVLFAPWAGNEVTVDGEVYLLMSEKDIFGIYKE